MLSKDIGKARLVIRGFKDKNTYEINETNAPVSRQSTVKLFLAIVNKLNLELAQMDVKTAFLNSFIEKDIYMEIPLGVECSDALAQQITALTIIKSMDTKKTFSFPRQHRNNEKNQTRND